jgi:NAD(P)-dependent dehydrogenase (short-subunit alcohol dehydrogenase family)
MSDQVALVAGGTGGLGRAVSLAFLEQGAQVVVTYQKLAELEALKASAGARAASLAGESVDVTDEAAVRGLVERIVAKHGRLDALVNTVGAYFGGAKLWEVPVKDFERMIALNLRAGFVLARAAAPAMLKQGKGAIVNVAARTASDHAAGASAYAASKAGAVAMIDSLAADLHGTDVRANSILPGIIDTKANREAMPNANFAKWPKPGDIARVILFLCSDDAKLVSGAAVPVYGDS